MFSKIGCLAKLKVPGIWKASMLFRNAWAIFFVLYQGTFWWLLMSLKWHQRTTTAAGRQNLPLDGAIFLSQRSIFQRRKCIRYQKHVILHNLHVLRYYFDFSGAYFSSVLLSNCYETYFLLVLQIQYKLLMNHHSHMYEAVLDNENCLELFLWHFNLGDQLHRCNM